MIINAPAKLLHVPHKDWDPNPSEKQNYDEIERWSQRIQRGVIFQGQQNNEITGIAVGSGVAVVESQAIGLTVGRTYRAFGQWPGLASTTAGDIMAMWISVEPRPGSIHPGFTGNFAINTIYLRMQVGGVYHEGGSMFAWIQPDKNFNGPFVIGLFAGLSSGTGPGRVMASQTSNANQVPSLLVEDMGAV